MKNHIPFLTKLKFMLHGYKIRPVTKRDCKDYKYLDDYFIVKRKYERKISLIDSQGNTILPLGNYKLVACCVDTILVFNEDTLVIEARSLSNGNAAYKVMAYSNKDAFFETLYAYDEVEESFIDTLKLSFILDASKRWRITNYDGTELVSGLIDIMLYKNDLNLTMAVGLRYEDHFAILTSKGKIEECDIICYDNLTIEHDLPLVIGKRIDCFSSKKKEMRYFFVGITGEIKFNTPCRGIMACNDSDHYLGVLDDNSFVIFNKDGSTVLRRSFYASYPFVSNRALVKDTANSFYYLVDENDRTITNDSLGITKVYQNFERIPYGAFTMTLALVQSTKLGKIYIDKELHPYYYLSDNEDK